ncbi:MAG: amylosucrase [Anaerolineae bacterium]|nr:amylosucrase [Anaerolineae bacterium]
MDLSYHAKRTFQRLYPSLEEHFASFAVNQPDEWKAFTCRLERHFEPLFGILYQLYGNVYDFYYYLEQLLICMAEAWEQRSRELKDLDAEREQNPHWFQSNQMLGGVCYVDLFAGKLRGICEKIPYFKELGLTYLHLMPLFQCPSRENDGGYAVSSYREVRADLGTVEELQSLAQELRHNGISLVLDFVFNHTSNEHEWATKARAGDPEYQEYFFIFPDRSLPDLYQPHLREIFPEEHPGAFTYVPEMKKWVWTTFHSYQWDLNYQNPAVFVSMVKEMLFLANIGVEVLRLDAVAFIWKRMGTNCENLPEAHLIIQAFNMVARVAVPSLTFKSEAIVHPDEVIRYISPGECQLSYNPLLMALLWNSLATREVRLLRLALQERFELPSGCSWVNYVRCHDDIGWTFSDEDAIRLGINGFDHRKFLNAFYTGRFPGSFARGLFFQENPRTGDMRVSGTCASLAGLEKAIYEETEIEQRLAVRRIVLLHAIILTIGGIPLIYLGDEVGTLNDYSYRRDPAKSNDSRWVHRPFIDWRKMDRRHAPHTLEGQIYGAIQRLISLRKTTSAFCGQEMRVFETGNDQVLGYVRSYQGEHVLILANFGETEQQVSADLLRLYGLSYRFVDLFRGGEVPFGNLTLGAYEVYFLRAE